MSKYLQDESVDTNFKVFVIFSQLEINVKSNLINIDRIERNQGVKLLGRVMWR